MVAAGPGGFTAAARALVSFVVLGLRVWGFQGRSLDDFVGFCVPYGFSALQA